MLIAVGEVEDRELHGFVHLFRSVFPREVTAANCERYLLGLVSDLPRKNGERIAELFATSTDGQFQQFPADCPWDPDALDRARLALMDQRGFARALTACCARTIPAGSSRGGTRWGLPASIAPAPARSRTVKSW